MITEMATLANANDAETCGNLNRRFHGFIINHCPNRKLAALVNDLWDRAERGLLVYRKGAGFLSESHKQHAQMVRLIRSRDLAGLRRLSTEHSRFGLEAVRGLGACQQMPALTAAGGSR